MAEVLITLGIIGVVAALTMPALIANHQKKQTVVKLKKAYTEIAQAVNLSVMEYGPIANWEYGTAFDGASAANFADKYLVPHLNVIKNCGFDTGCLGGDVYSLGDIKTYASGDADEKSARFIVNSGYTVGVVSGGTYANIYIALDNKKNKPIAGKDVFHFQIVPRTSQDKMIPHGIFDSPSGVYRTRTEIKDNESYGCHRGKSGGTGMNCSALIMMDSWQIADDYPW